MNYRGYLLIAMDNMNGVSIFDVAREFEVTSNTVVRWAAGALIPDSETRDLICEFVKKMSNINIEDIEDIEDND